MVTVIKNICIAFTFSSPLHLERYISIVLSSRISDIFFSVYLQNWRRDDLSEWHIRRRAIPKMSCRLDFIIPSQLCGIFIIFIAELCRWNLQWLHGKKRNGKYREGVKNEFFLPFPLFKNVWKSIKTKTITWNLYRHRSFIDIGGWISPLAICTCYNPFHGTWSCHTLCTSWAEMISMVMMIRQC